MFPLPEEEPHIAIYDPEHTRRDLRFLNGQQICNAPQPRFQHLVSPKVSGWSKRVTPPTVSALRNTPTQAGQLCINKRPGTSPGPRALSQLPLISRAPHSPPIRCNPVPDTRRCNSHGPEQEEGPRPTVSSLRSTPPGAGQSSSNRHSRGAPLTDPRPAGRSLSYLSAPGRLAPIRSPTESLQAQVCRTASAAAEERRFVL
ncbi:hypothetical protein NDU88_005923 [Pleurodeles waltl]|uniref:Uncharacterized protein n=1 Tax=Pleurodeles waltl TaxID=8319 RepID=A0AAV7SN25_PLEWA|nr:hypothetical protein NDU88_005923 [Pleurodeles waltl]